MFDRKLVKDVWLNSIVTLVYFSICRMVSLERCYMYAKYEDTNCSSMAGELEMVCSMLSNELMINWTEWQLCSFNICFAINKVTFRGVTSWEWWKYAAWYSCKKVPAHILCSIDGMRLIHTETFLSKLPWMDLF